MKFKGKLLESEVGPEPQTLQAIRSAFNFLYFLPHHHHFFITQGQELNARDSRAINVNTLAIS